MSKIEENCKNKGIFTYQAFFVPFHQIKSIYVTARCYVTESKKKF